MPGKKPIPDFKTEKEEQEFWATHSSLYHLDFQMRRFFGNRQLAINN